MCISERISERVIEQFARPALSSVDGGAHEEFTTVDEEQSTFEIQPRVSALIFESDQSPFKSNPDAGKTDVTTKAVKTPVNGPSVFL